MKRKVLIGLAAMLCCFFIGGFYIIFSIDKVISKLENIITFHNVATLRENLENHIRVVQEDLLLQNSPHAQVFDVALKHIQKVEAKVNACRSCHHVMETAVRLEHLAEETRLYMGMLSRTMTLSANQRRLEIAKAEAFNQGNILLAQVANLSGTSATGIAERNVRIRMDIFDTQRLIVTLVIVGPIALLLATAFFLRRFAGSIDILVDAANRLEGGDLDYQIQENLKDEFKVLAGAFNRMTLSIKAEKVKLESAQKLYQALFESAEDAIFILDTEGEAVGRIIAANKAAAKLHGCDPAELPGKRIHELSSEDPPEKFRARLKKILNGEWLHYVVTQKRMDGTEFPAECRIGLLEMDRHEYVLCFSRDITTKLQEEMEQLRANQMVLIGQMAAGLAHEIKNPLAGIKVSMEVLADEIELKQEDKELFAQIINEVRRMERLLKNLLNYARPPQPQFDLVDVNRLVDQAIKGIEVTTAHSRQKTVHFRRNFLASQLQVEADSSQFQQVLLNLYINAIEACTEEGIVATQTSLEDDGRVRIDVTDNGRGMPADTLGKIFTPFFTTKSKGTGLGLGICKRLVEQHEGTIEVSSTPDEGTKVSLFLPTRQKPRE